MKRPGRKRRGRSAPAFRPDRMEAAVRAFLEACGLPPRRGELARTPARVARAWRKDLLSGYAEDPERILAPLPAARSRDLVAVRDIPFVSTCVHHLLPFHGLVHVAYLPAGAITGVSRIAALVRCLTRRLQIQEDLSREIAETLQRRLGADGAACVIEATHLCLTARGERSAGARVVTSAFTGSFRADASGRAAALALLATGAPPAPRRRRAASGARRRRRRG